MSKRFVHLAFAAATVALVACSNDESEPYVYNITGEEEHGAHDGHDHGDGSHAAEEVVTQTYAVACGCSLEEVGACGNFVEVDGEYVEIVGDVGLGSMEWCGRSGQQAKLAGTVHDGAFHATAWVKE